MRAHLAFCCVGYKKMESGASKQPVLSCCALLLLRLLVLGSSSVAVVGGLWLLQQKQKVATAGFAVCGVVVRNALSVKNLVKKARRGLNFLRMH